ncbi:MAG TPA: hypothetical protein VKP11_08185, partial [Frankiaceae bacterium]|nr:hypothetical protein [Frankiaceae bacterium]
MSDVVLAAADPQELLSHLFLYGSGALCEEAGVARLRLSWTTGMQPWPVVHGEGFDDRTLAE